MKREMRPVAIIGGVRTPFAKSFTKYMRVSNQELFTAALRALVERYGLTGRKIDEVAGGSVMKHSSDWNLVRESVLSSGLDPRTPAYDVQRACGTSLETANQVALKIASGQIEVAIAGGSDTNSDIPVTYPREMGTKLLELRGARTTAERLKALTAFHISDLKPVVPGVVEPRTHLSMGQHTEKMVKEWGIGRVEQDELALRSHMTAARAYAEGFYKDLVIEFQGLSRDTSVRDDTSLEKLGKLRPAFDTSEKGTLTAGNSSPLTDGAAAVLYSSEEWAKANGHEPLAYLTDVQATAVDFVAGEGLLIAPTIAVSELLKRNNLRLQDFDYYEIHEAFAGQVLCTLKAWESADYCREKLGRSEAMGSIDVTKMNVHGGSVALGHPFAATGARIIATLAKTLKINGRGRGLISICTAGGMGLAAIVERNAR